MKIICPKCGVVEALCRDNYPHIGIYCGECGKWIKWASKNEKNLISKIEK